MKWTDDLVEKATSMAKMGMSYKDISIKLNVETRCVNIKMNRLGIKNTEFKKNIVKKCLNCGEIIAKNKMFCSHSCSAIYNNKKKGKKTEEEKNKIKLSIIRNLGYDTIEDWKNSKEKKQSIKKNISVKILKDGRWVCKKCGDENCERPDVCKNYFRNDQNVLEKYLGFDSSKIGTKDFYKEFDRIINTLKYDYYINELSYSDLSSKYNVSTSSISSLFKRLKIKIRNISDSTSLAVKNGKMNYDNINIYPYKSGYHATWNNKEVHYRSSYELEYYKKLDEQKIDYEVEKIRIYYYDTQREKQRIAIPDVYIPSENKLVEIKSKWTYNEQNWKDRLKSYKKLGYVVKLIMGHGKNTLFENYKEINY